MDSKIQIITVEAERELDRRFFINLPVDKVKSPGECFHPKDEIYRVEIPQSLARFINDLNEENENLRRQLKRARQPMSM